MAQTEPLTACVVFARQAVRTVDALVRDLPADVGEPLMAGARADLAQAEEQEREWLHPTALAGMVAHADRIRDEAKAARGGEDYYTAEARRLGRE